jgi:regulatory protein YycI of two-component signal transduction system YycFG
MNILTKSFNIIIILIILLCAAFIVCSKEITKSNGNRTNEAITGWLDDDTYTVSVTAETQSKAVDMARHRILKDVVDVRVRKGSKYTDISMIKEEFKIPLENGQIIKSKNTAEGIKIYYQIREKNLRKKFEL